MSTIYVVLKVTYLRYFGLEGSWQTSFVYGRKISETVRPAGLAPVIFSHRRDGWINGLDRASTRPSMVLLVETVEEAQVSDSVTNTVIIDKVTLKSIQFTYYFSIFIMEIYRISYLCGLLTIEISNVNIFLKVIDEFYFYHLNCLSSIPTNYLYLY